MPLQTDVTQLRARIERKSETIEQLLRHGFFKAAEAQCRELAQLKAIMRQQAETFDPVDEEVMDGVSRECPL